MKADGGGAVGCILIRRRLASPRPLDEFLQAPLEQHWASVLGVAMEAGNAAEIEREEERRQCMIYQTRGQLRVSLYRFRQGRDEASKSHGWDKGKQGVGCRQGRVGE